ncbi:MAG: neuraminidase-like domain-containing protein, partial [Fibrobacterota bacterium]
MFSALDSISFGDRLRMQAGTDIAPLLVNWGSGTVDVGADSVTGSVLSVGPVTLRDRAKVDGSVETAATVTKSNGASVTGQTVERTTLQLPATPTISVTWPTSSKYGFTVESGTSASKVAGAYGNIVVRSNGTLNLAAGVYFMVSLLMEADAKLVVEPGVVIHVREGLTIRGQFRYAAGAVAQVAILYRGAAAAIVEREFHGSILAPYAQLTLGANVPVVFAGQFLAKQLVVRTDVTAIAETLADGGIFPHPPVGGITYTGDARVVVHRVGSDTYRCKIEGGLADDILELRPSGSVSVKANSNLPWTLRLEKLDSTGNWIPLPAKIEKSSRSGEFLMDFVVPQEQGDCVLRVERLDGVPVDVPYVLSGTIKWEDGQPYSGLVRAFDKDLRGQQFVGSCATDADGNYSIQFTMTQFQALEHKGPDLFIAAIDDSTIPVDVYDSAKISAVRFNSGSSTRIDLVLVGRPFLSISEYEELEMRIHPLLGEVRAGDLDEANDVQFLSNELDVRPDLIRIFVVASRLSKGLPGVPAMAFYGWIRMGLPRDLQNLSRQSEETLKTALAEAHKQAVIDIGKFSAGIAEFIALIRPALDLARSENLRTQLKTVFVGEWWIESRLETLRTLYLAHSDNLDSFWSAVRNDAEFGELRAAQMQMKLALMQVCEGWEPLAAKLLEVAGPQAKDTSSLVSLSLDDLIRIVRATGTTKIPKDMSEGPYDPQIEAVAKNLKRTIEYAHPKEVLVHQLKNSVSVDVSAAKILLANNRWIDPRRELPTSRQLSTTGLEDPVEFQKAILQLGLLKTHLRAFPIASPGDNAESRRAALVESIIAASAGSQARFGNPMLVTIAGLIERSDNFKIGKIKFDEFLQETENRQFFEGLDQTEKAEAERLLRAFIRLYAIVPRFDVVVQLLERGYRSAGQIAKVSHDKFVEDFGSSAFGDSLVQAIHRAARKISQAATHFHGLVQSAKTTLPTRAMGAGPKNSDGFPSWDNLFERPTSVVVPEWQSVLSPGAYFVELLHYLESLETTTPPGKAAPFDALLQRRPDLVRIKLGRESTFDEISHSQLVLEILQAYAAQGEDWTVETWEDLEWDDIPGLADDAISAASYPLDLPVDARRNDQDLLLQKLGLRLCDLPGVFKIGEGDGWTISTLGLSNGQFEILTNQAPTPERIAEIWGRDSAGVDRVGSMVKEFVDAAGVSVVEIEQYKETRYCGDEIIGIGNLERGLDAMTFEPSIEREGLQRANRFFRLLKALRRFDSSRTVHELDCAIAALSGSNEIDSQFLSILASALRVSKRVGSNWFEMLELFGSLDTRKETILDADGVMGKLPSRFERVFRKDDPGSNDDLFAVNEDGSMVQTGSELDLNKDAVRKALGIDASEFDSVFELTELPADQELNVQNLSKIHRSRVLCDLLDADPQSLLFAKRLLDAGDLTDPFAMESFLEIWAGFSALEIPTASLRFLYANPGTGSEGIVPISTNATDLKHALVKGFKEIDDALEGLVEAKSTPVVDTRKIKKSELVARVLSEALEAEQAVVLHLLSMTIPASGAVGNNAIDDILNCELDAASFEKSLLLVQKVLVFTSILRLSIVELDEMVASSSDWGDLNLTDLLPAADRLTNSDAADWFGPIFKYADLSRRIPAPKKNAPTLLSVLKDGIDASEWGAVAELTGWDAESLLVLARLWNPAAEDLANAGFLHAAIPAMRICSRIGSTAGAVASWIPAASAGESEDATTAAIKEAVRNRLDKTEWKSALSTFLVDSRNFRRERLVAYLLSSGDLPRGIKSSNQLYQYFLIDVEMDAGQMTSRLVQGIATIQQFVQRCFLNLENGIGSQPGQIEDPEVSFEGVSPASFDASRWSWMKNYRVWEANRRVFLYPENYIEPELRSDKSEFFRELEESLSQSEVSTENVEKAFHDYLAKLDSVARLKIVAHAQDPYSGVTHVFGRTDELPGIHYHRTCTQGVWSGWLKMPIEIPSEHLAPVFYNRRLYLYWLEFAEKADQPKQDTLEAGNGSHKASRPAKHWEVSLAWTELQYGKWSAKKISAQESGSTDNPRPGSSLILENSSSHPSDYRLMVTVPGWEFDDGRFVSLDGSGQGEMADRRPGSQLVLRLMALKEVYRAPETLPGIVLPEPRVKQSTWDKVGGAILDIGKSIAEPFKEVANVLVNSLRTPNTVELIELGRWSVSRPGGKLQLSSAPTDAHAPSTKAKWSNNCMNWEYTGSLAFETPRGWDDPYFTGDYDNELTTILEQGSTGWILPAPYNAGTEIQVPWAPFFVQDLERSYWVTGVTDSRWARLEPSHDNFPSAENLRRLSEINPPQALQYWKDNFAKDSNSSYFYQEYYSFLSGGGFYRTIKSARLRFQPHYHPYAGEMLADLASGGFSGLLAPLAQARNDGAGVFEGYKPTEIVAFDHPKEEIDFSMEGAYSLYNWEVFFHIPLFVASRLAADKKFDEARKWLHFLFDPTTTTVDQEENLRFWKFAPLASNVDTARIQQLLSLYRSEQTPENNALRQKVTDQIAYSANHPFEPHGIARLRMSAYQKSVFMKYLDNLIEWADQLFATDTRESVNEATQLYILADDLLGPQPERVPRQLVETKDYLELRANLDDFGNSLVSVEDWFADVPLGTESNYQTDTAEADGAAVSGVGVTTYFAIPDNEKLAGYWTLVDDRLYKIRHGLDINGNARSLSLFAPRLDPADLVKGAASGKDLNSVDSNLSGPVPLYRFATLLPKALEFCNEVKSFGGALLSALEKKDAETLGIKRGQYEIALLQMTRKIREEQIRDAEIALEGLRKTRENAQFRRDYYRGIERVSTKEKDQVSLLEKSSQLQIASQALQALAGPAHAVPDFVIGCSGFGGTPHVTAKTGGTTISEILQSGAATLSILAGIESHRANKASILASQQRRATEWDFQGDSAQREMDQIDIQIQGAQSRIKITKAELASQELQIRNSQAVEEFLKSKFTNDQLYNWMSGQISGLYFTAYQLAFQLAKQVEACFAFEKHEAPVAKISFGAWDGLRKGLLAGEKLAMDLRRLEMEYMKKNKRDPELTKSVSLVSLNPAAVIALKTTGACEFTLPEALFDLDHPGHFQRRIKSVSVTLPCVTGPYSGVNGKLTLKTNRIRASDKTKTYDNNEKVPGPNPFGPIVLSSGQNDTGMFEMNLRDERYLPFEGCGVVDSEWELKIPRESNGFDLDTISDVVLRIQYTAVVSQTTGFDRLALGQATLPAITYPTAEIKPLALPKDGQPNLLKMFSLRHEFADSWHSWMRDGSGKPTRMIGAMIDI